MIKTLNKQGIQEDILNMIKATYEKLTANIILNDGCGMWAQLLHGMWILVPRAGIEPVSPASQGRFSTSGPPGKPQLVVLTERGWHEEDKTEGQEEPLAPCPTPDFNLLICLK